MTRARKPLKRTYLALVLALLGLSAAALDPTSSHAQRRPPDQGSVLKGRYVVVYRQTVASVDREVDAQERAGRFQATLRYRHAVKGFAAKLSGGQVARLRADPDVAFVDADREAHVAGAVPLAAGEPVPPTGVRRIGAATTTTSREASVAGVAVIDSGIDLAHPDLNAVNGVNCLAPGAPAQDDHGHGTYVAGTVAARNDGAGVVGVAPDTPVFAVKSLDSSGSGSASGVICGLDWVTANARRLDIGVVNMSLGLLIPSIPDANCGRTDGDALHSAVCRTTEAGVSVVSAAGNSARPIAAAPSFVPAAYPEVLTATAMSDGDGRAGRADPRPSCLPGNADDGVATFSNYATRSIDSAHTVAAPGVCITSTWPGKRYVTGSGTSVAAPHVAGAVALCLGEGGVAGPCAGKSPAQVVERIRDDAAAYSSANPSYGFTGDPLRPSGVGYFGHLARAPGAPADDTAPDTTITAGPPRTTSSASARLEFSADEPGGTFECRLDAGGWAPCASPQTVTGLSDGRHAFSVRATDQAGNTDASEATRTWTVDTTVPDTAITSGPSGTTESSSASFAFSSSEPEWAFECKLDGGEWAACFSPRLVEGLADGPHTFSVRASDEAGNTDQSPAVRAFTVKGRGLPPDAADAPLGGGPLIVTSPGAGPSVGASIAAALQADLAGVARALRRLGIAKLLRRRGLKTPALNALSAGRLSVTLTGRPGRAGVARSARVGRGAGIARRVRLARGSRPASKAGRYAVTLRLTRQGRRLLGRDRRARVTVTLAFRRASAEPVARSAAVTLRR